jgi:uncharacterized protein YndB with AHSA1/START domain
MMKQIEETYTINAPIQKVYEALTSANLAEKWGAAPAKVDSREGGEFSYWDGDIYGIFTKLVSNQLIEQDWYGHDHPERKFNAVFAFEENKGVTQVHLKFSGDIEDEQKDIADWRDY